MKLLSLSILQFVLSINCVISQTPLTPNFYIDYGNEMGIDWVAEIYDEELKSMPTYTGSDHLRSQPFDWPDIVFDSTSWYTCYSSSLLTWGSFDRLYVEKRSLSTGELLWRNYFSLEEQLSYDYLYEFNINEGSIELIMGHVLRECQFDYNELQETRNDPEIRWVEIEKNSGTIINDKIIDLEVEGLGRYSKSKTAKFSFDENILSIYDANLLEDSIHMYKFNLDGQKLHMSSSPIYTNITNGEPWPSNNGFSIKHLGLDTVYLNYPILENGKLNFVMQQYVKGLLERETIVHQGLQEYGNNQCYIWSFGYTPNKVLYRVFDNDEYYFATYTADGMIERVFSLENYSGGYALVEYENTNLLFVNHRENGKYKLALLKSNTDGTNEIIHLWNNQYEYVTVVNDAHITPDGDILVYIRYSYPNTIKYQFAWIKVSSDFIKSGI